MRLKKISLMIGLCLLVVGLSACKDSSLSSKERWPEIKESKVMVWGVKSESRLFGYMNVKNSQLEGFEIDLAKAITKDMLGKNSQIKFAEVSGNTRIPLLKNGNVDAVIATLTITPERKKVVDFSDVYFNAGQSLLVKKGSKIKSVKDLKPGTKVIGVQGSNSVENIKKVAPKTQVLQLSDYGQAFTALRSGQADVMTSDNGMLYGMSADDPNYVVTGGAFTSEPYGIAVNKHQKQLLSHINRSLQHLRQTGEYDRIVKKWFGSINGFDAHSAEKEVTTK